MLSSVVLGVNLDPEDGHTGVINCIPDEEDDQVDDEGRRLEDLAEWLLRRVQSLRIDAADRHQLSYVNRVIGNRIARLRESYEADENGRSAARTWGNPDTTFLA